MRLSMNHPVEIRTLNLQPNIGEEFQRLYIEIALPRSNIGTSMWWYTVRHFTMRIPIT